MSVLDASVVLKWFVDENDSDKAVRLREEYYFGERDIIVPDLFLFEVSNALRYNQDFKVSEIIESIRSLFDMGIKIVTPTSSLLERAIEMARNLDITCYDATYLALAEDLEFEFITADSKLYNKILKKDTVKLLAHMPSYEYEG